MTSPVIAELGPTSDYTRVAHIYDSTRNVPETVLRQCYERARRAGLLPQSGLVLDAGCGTGQASLVLAEMGFEVLGYDATPAMVAIATHRAEGKSARYAVGDVRELPEPAERFDAAVVAKLFQHVGGWQRGVAEIVRVLRPGACVLLVDERGAKNPVRETFARFLAESGHASGLPGSRDPASIAAAFIASGCRKEEFDGSGLNWPASLRIGDALEQLGQRVSAEFWSVPDDVYEHLLARTASWADQQPGRRDATPMMEPYLSVEVFRKPS